MNDFNFEDLQRLLELFLEQKTVSGCLKLRDDLFKSDQFENLKEEISKGNHEDKKILGKKLGIIRQNVQITCDNRIKSIQSEKEKDNFVDFDPTFYYSHKFVPGNLHPLTLISREALGIFAKMGFDIYDGGQIQSQWNNFTSVGTPCHHPARAMQDTFWLEEKCENGENLVLRTQMTSSLFEYSQNIKNQNEGKPKPFRVIFEGIVFRAENIDSTHDINFHQFDGWLVDKQVSISQLITLLTDFLTEFFEQKVELRLRPSYFPFTEPSLEIDMFCPWFKRGQWIEIAGAGPIDHKVLANIGFDPTNWQGLAFGFGLTRLAQLKLEITGLGQFYNNNLDFLVN